MITIEPATSAAAATIAALWNAKRLDSASCWYQAEAVDAGYIGQLMQIGFEFSRALDDELPVGFGFWRGGATSARLVALAADSDEIYYRLLLTYCDWALALGAEYGLAEIGAAMTTERGRMDALNVIQYVPIGYEPLAPGQNPAERVPTMLRAQCLLSVLRDAVTQILEPAP